MKGECRGWRCRSEIPHAAGLAANAGWVYPRRRLAACSVLGCRTCGLDVLQLQRPASFAAGREVGGPGPVTSPSLSEPIRFGPAVRLFCRQQSTIRVQAGTYLRRGPLKRHAVRLPRHQDSRVPR
jgi:hypothetical protein